MKYYKWIFSLVLILSITKGYGQIRLSDLNNKTEIIGTEKIPVSGSGNPSITPNLLKDFISVSGGVWNITSTQPTSTSDTWVDSGNAYIGAYPIRNYINGAWTPVTEECDWWDTIGGVISKGKPIAILFSGQSNAGGATYFPSGEPSYTGDISVDKYVSLWQPVTNEFEVFDATSATNGIRTWYYPSGGGTASSTDGIWNIGKTNQFWIFAKLYAKQFNRSVRFVGMSRGGQPLAQWEDTKSAWVELKALADASGVSRFDAFIFVHGEGGLSNSDNPSSFSYYKDSFYDFISRLKSQSWADEKLKVIMPSHGLNDAFYDGAHSATVLSLAGDLGAEGTIRSLDNQDNPYYGWAAAFFAREAQNGASDPYHFTTREMERFGAAIFQTYLSLPNYKKGDKLIRTFYTNSGNRLTSVKLSVPNTDDYELQHSSGTATGSWKRSFSSATAYLPDVQEQVRGTGSNYVEWAMRSSATTPGTLEDKITINTSGVNIPKLLNITGYSTGGSSTPTAAIKFSGSWIGSDNITGNLDYYSPSHTFYLGSTVGAFLDRQSSITTFDVFGNTRASKAIIGSTSEVHESNVTLKLFGTTSGYIQKWNDYLGDLQGGIAYDGTVTFVKNVTASKYFVSALNTAPASASATGTTGEIRFGSGYIYVCIATNTWVRTQLTTW